MTTRPDASFRPDIPANLVRLLHRLLVDLEHDRDQLRNARGSLRAFEEAIGYTPGIEPGLEAEVIDLLRVEANGPGTMLSSNKVADRIWSARVAAGQPSPTFADVVGVLERLVENRQAKFHAGGYGLVEPMGEKR
jgi:hypothetical protein